MRYFLLFVCLGFAGTAFGQLERHGNSRPWEVFAGYQIPIGKWAEEVDFNAPGRPIYHGSFSGRTGQHARMGFYAGVAYTLTSVGRSGFAKNFQVIFYPGIFSAVLYDLESNGPPIESSKITPWLQYEAAVAPCYSLNTGANTLKFLIRFGVAAKHTAGEVHFEPGSPIAIGEYFDHVKYSYTGAGVNIGPGVKFIAGRISIGAELQLGFATGKYKGERNYVDANGNFSNPRKDNVPNCIVKSPLLGVTIGYAFGGD